jgi:hypothetical protein
MMCAECDLQSGMQCDLPLGRGQPTWLLLRPAAPPHYPRDAG